MWAFAVQKSRTGDLMRQRFTNRRVALIHFNFLLWLIVTALGFSSALAKAVDRHQAAQMVQRFLQSESSFPKSGEFRLRELQKIGGQPGQDSLYLARLSPVGFVLLPADDRLSPILGYSFRNTFSGNEPLRALLARRIRAEWQAVNANPSLAMQNQSEWQADRTNVSLNKASGDSVYYFPTPVWGQGNANGVYVFNYYTPNHWSAGCVATAMAEVLAYYQWPIVGTNRHCYTENDAGQLCVDYSSAYYDWPNILFKYEGERTTSTQRRAAGLLTYHAAVSVNMDFSANGSTANVSNTPAAFHNYFRLSGHYKRVTDSGFWDELINNMKDHRPAILAIHRSDGLGHAIVADGYSERNQFFHLNMGWNGSDNGWYDISGTWNAGGYNAVDGASKGLLPNPMICSQVEQLADTVFVLRWRVSPKLRAQYFELQQAPSATGPWQTLNSAISDTFFTVHVSTIGNYYYRVRARQDNIWWDWSATQKIALGGPRYLTFNVNMNFQTLSLGDSVVLRGNIPPLQGSKNSPALHDTTGDGIYSITLPFDLDYVGQELLYRFAIAGANGTKMESFNRTYVIGYARYQNLDTVYFDDYTALRPDERLPGNLELLGNFPNPFNPETVIRYKLQQRTRVKLVISDLLGRTVRVLVDRVQNPGEHAVRFQAQNLSSGIYVYRLFAGSQVRTAKMLLLR